MRTINGIIEVVLYVNVMTKVIVICMTAWDLFLKKKGLKRKIQQWMLQ